MLALANVVATLCPLNGAPPAGHPPVLPLARRVAQLPSVDYNAVRKDLRLLFSDSKSTWPADYNFYGPFFVRLAWHNSGSYRNSDGRGGADGARQRFDPERSWADNTNLDKARSLLWPIKLKFGLGLSWGDLIILAGNTAIEAMGGPVLGFCGGRIDDADGSESAGLGPTAEQELTAPCPVNGTCKPPLGSTTVGLIYVNPEGPLGHPDPVGSARAVRDTFGRMAMNDSETVALIGGGHAFGKTHGACPAGAGPSPKEDPTNPWPGKCGTGRGADAWTSGFEGAWTENPTRWDNKYFQYLHEFKYEVHVGPGGHHQWRVAGGGPRAPAAAGNGTQAVMMLTSDISLTRDPENSYQSLVTKYATNLKVLEHDFAHAWYKLTTRDMGPISRCLGKDVPPAQDWQLPLPPSPPPAMMADIAAVKAELQPLLSDSNRKLLVRAAWSCGSTFRHTDYQGGCNGARLRFAPQKDFASNAGLDQVFKLLAPIKQMHDMREGSQLSWADLIVLGATTALEPKGEMAAALLSVSSLSFCAGRTDALDAGTLEQQISQSHLAPRIHGNASDTLTTLRLSSALMGLSDRELVALKQQVWRHEATREVDLSNDYYRALISGEWRPVGGGEYYAADGFKMKLLKADLLLRWDAELLAIAQQFAEDESLFVDEFGSAWTKLMNADRFGGPASNVCDVSRRSSAVEVA